MRFLVDAQLPASLARMLVSKGYVAEHVSDIAMSSASDTAIWQYALSTSSIIVTQDEDFAQRKTLVPAGPSVIWIRLGNTRTQPLLHWFDVALPRVIDALERGETFIELV